MSNFMTQVRYEKQCNKNIGKFLTILGLRSQIIRTTKISQKVLPLPLGGVHKQVPQPQVRTLQKILLDAPLSYHACTTYSHVAQHRTSSELSRDPSLLLPTHRPPLQHGSAPGRALHSPPLCGGPVFFESGACEVARKRSTASLADEKGRPR